MCGFAGVLQVNGAPLREDIRAVLKGMGDQIAYRGPDDEHLYCADPIGMIFRRLSIVDLSADGRQPMSNEDGSVILMVNGEIFNHREVRKQLHHPHHFRSRSDSEVILHLYEEKGLDFLHDLNGMYGLALWDQKNRRLILARDRLGIKPLYYSISNDRLIFGSEIKALFPYPDCPREFEWQQALSFQQWRRFPERDKVTMSFFKGIEYLPAGCAVIFDLREKKLRQWRYWDLQPLSSDEYAADRRSDAEIIDGYRDLLEASVLDCLSGDVEVGIFLSGGIDSVAIAALAAKHYELQSFSVLSQSTIGSGDARAAHFSAQHLGIANHQVLFPLTDEHFSAEAWRDLLWLIESPICEAEHIYKHQLHRYARATRPNLKVILVGQGSDEFNGGYSKHWLERTGVPPEAQNWGAFMDLIDDQQMRGAAATLPHPLLTHVGRFRIVTPDFVESLSGRPRYANPWLANADLSRSELQMYNLWHEDRTASGNSIENRVPFLDHRLVEYTMGVPPHRHARLFWNKNILREAFARDLPSSLHQRPKVPFYVGPAQAYTYKMLYEMLTSDKGALIEEAFGDADGPHPVLEKSRIRAMFDLVPSNPQHRSVTPLLKLTNMALLEKMARSAPTHPRRATPPEVLSAVEIKDWDRQFGALEAKLAGRNTVNPGRPAPDPT